MKPNLYVSTERGISVNDMTYYQQMVQAKMQYLILLISTTNKFLKHTGLQVKYIY